MSNFDDVEYIAATVISQTEDTTKKAHGTSFESYKKQFFEETWDKFRVITIDDGGAGSGKGGGAGDDNTARAGNSGTKNEAGGTSGQVSGQGKGSGNVVSESGKGNGTTGGSTGFVSEDAFRTLREKIEESRAESLRRVSETAAEIESVKASIAERESIQSSIRKRLQQESMKSKITQAETQKQYETPVYIEETKGPGERLEVYNEISRPTFTKDIRYREENLGPTTAKNNINNSITRAETITISEFEPGDFVEITEARNHITYDLEYTSIRRPTSDKIEETIQSATLEFFDSPIVEEETMSIEETMSESKTYQLSNEEIALWIEQQSIEQSLEETTKKKETETIDEEQGEDGGKEPDEDEDLFGDDVENESRGSANDKGELKEESEGEFAGKKIFEIDVNGNIGLDPEHLSITNMKGMMAAVITLIFLLGALIFLNDTKDSIKKNNYF